MRIKVFIIISCFTTYHSLFTMEKRRILNDVVTEQGSKKTRVTRDQDQTLLKPTTMQKPSYLPLKVVN